MMPVCYCIVLQHMCACCFAVQVDQQASEQPAAAAADKEPGAAADAAAAPAADTEAKDAA